MNLSFLYSQVSLQELQTSVVNCGNASIADSICTGAVTLQKVEYLHTGPWLTQSYSIVAV